MKVNQFSPKIIYSPNYDIHFFGIERLHPFDSCKYGRAWDELRKTFGDSLSNYTIFPEKPVSEDDLKSIHSEEYLKKIESSEHGSMFIAQALEIPLLALLPNSILKSKVLMPMRWATEGTIIAAREALKSGIAINLSGGYHHASKDQGEGFCIYSDIAVAIAKLRSEKLIAGSDKVIIIDLDAHQGNGLERIFFEDKAVYFFDMYNQDIYPADEWAEQRIDCNVPLASGIDGEQYLKILTERLPKFLRNVGAKIAFYNAGSDIFDQDPLGRLNVSREFILKRDLFVASLLTDMKIPWVMMPSGGYTRESFRIIAESVSQIISKFGGKIMTDPKDKKNSDSDEKIKKLKTWETGANIVDKVIRIVDGIGKIKNS